MKKIGMFGGSFNPVHNAHTMFAKGVIQTLGLTRLYIMPTYSSPHKSDDNMAPAADRYNMCKIAFDGVKHAEVSDLEISRKGKSYTYETLRELKEIHKNDELYIIMGADMFMTLMQWKNPQIIFNLSTIVTFPRDLLDITKLEMQSKMLESFGAKSIILNEKTFDLSSTVIRENIGDKEFISRNLNNDVYKYIINHKLYGV